MASFKSAFASARKAGKKTFTWNGKKYTTKLKSEVKSKEPKNVPVPQSRPSGKTPVPSKRPTDGPNARRRPKIEGGSTKAAPKAETKEKSKAPAVGIAKAGSPIARFVARLRKENAVKIKQQEPKGGGGW